jgi:RND family efflux transporter MFP subunit
MRDRRTGLLAGVVAVILTVVGCNKPAPPPAPPPPAVTVARPVEREVIEWDDYTGRLEAVEFVEVRARVSGFIEKVHFVEGALVNKGDLLFSIDDALFQAEFNRAQAQVAQAAAQVANAEGELTRATEAATARALSQEEFEKRRYQLEAARATLAAAKAAAEQAHLNLQWTKVTAPITGRTSRAYVTAGNLINGGAGQATTLTTITSINPIYAYMDVDEQSVLKYQRLAQLNKRESARDHRIPIFMGLANEDGYPHEGVVDFVDNRVDPETGTMRARGVFENPPPGYLTPGLFARLRIPGSGRYRALLVPDVAIGTDQDQRFVLVVNNENTVERRVVKLGSLFGKFRAVEEGLKPDDRVIINGLQRARPGAKVNPQETQIDSGGVQMTAPNSPATQALPATRRLPSTRAVPPPATAANPTTAPTTGAAR